MAVGFPTKVNYATGDVLSATNMNDLSGTVNLLESAQYAAGKNKIINGDFGIWQRGTTFTSPTSTSYLADRFYESHDGTGTVTVTQQTFTAGTAPVAGYEGSYFLRQAVTAAGTSTFFQISQKIEDVRTLAGQTATVSFWAKADSARTGLVYGDQNFGTGGSTTVQLSANNVSLTTSWQRFSFTYAIPSISGKTIGTNSSLIFYFRNGGTASGANLDIWGVQVEAASSASVFQTATGTKQGELAACQRYYYRQTSASNYTYFGGGFAASTTQAKWMAKLPTTMRTSPSFSITNQTNLNIGAVTTQAVTTISLDQANPDSVGLFANCAAGLVAGQSVIIIGANSSAPYIEYSSEL
jgi:hypothetical protein